MAVTFVTFRSGNYTAVDHTPTAALSAGDVVPTVDGTLIIHRDIAANELGAAGALGGVYRAPKATGSGESQTAGDKLYWDATNDVATASASGNKPLGFVAVDADEDQAYVDFVHTFF